MSFVVREGLDKRVIGADLQINEVLAHMNLHGLTSLIVVDNSGSVVGVVTDGDLRRAWVSGTKRDDNVKEVLPSSFDYFDSETSPEDVFRAISLGKANGKRLYPIVDAQLKLLSIADAETYSIVPLSSISLSVNEALYVTKCLESGWLSSTGEFVTNFELEMSRQTGLPHPLAVSNGTAAITLALLALGVGALAPGASSGPEEFEVIVPSLTFGGSANGIIFAGATPVFAEVDADTWALSVDTISDVITDRTRAVLVVHLYGNPADTTGISALCKQRGLLLVEDCAEAIGSTVGPWHVGTHGDAATFSFFANKTITTGEGGMAFFRDREAFERATFLRNQGMNPDRKYWHEMAGFNYRMTNLQAAVGLGQAERFTKLVAEKMDTYRRYRYFLADCAGFDFMPQSPHGKSSCWLIAGLLPREVAGWRDAVLKQLNLSRIDARAVFPPLHTMPAYRYYPRAENLNLTSDLSRNGICLPSFVGIKDQQIQWVTDNLRKILDQPPL